VSVWRCYLQGRETVKMRRFQTGIHGVISEEQSVSLIFQVIPMGEVQGDAARSGWFEVELPCGTMHSFRGLKADITWEVVFTVTQTSGRSLTESFPIPILPPP
ncbi:MAG: hypothetical protein J0L84_10995, partial [Verrucomicrobia bacterium]|nr:hypothetical protein [Verrucomicrobiota bacterium]